MLLKVNYSITIIFMDPTIIWPIADAGIEKRFELLKITWV